MQRLGVGVGVDVLSYFFYLFNGKKMTANL